MPASPVLAGISVSGVPEFYIALQFRFASADKVRQNGEGFGLLPRKSESNDALCPMYRGDEQPHDALAQVPHSIRRQRPSKSCRWPSRAAD